MEFFYFTDTDGNNRLELENVLSVAGLGIPPVILTMSDRGHDIDGCVVTNAKYDARPFTVAWDVGDPDAYRQMRNIGAYFADNKPKTFWHRRNEDTPKCLTPVYLNAAVEWDMSDMPVKTLTMPFVAPEPWWKIHLPYTSVTFEDAALEFPLSIPETGVVMSTATYNIPAANAGDKEADTIIRFIGGAIQPFVKNITTGENLSVKRTVAVDEILEINSSTGRVDIIDAAGVRHNAFNYIGSDDDFIHLVKGDNTLTFGAGSGTVGYMEVGVVEYYSTV